MKATLTENAKWKKRRKKAITLCKKNDLWHDLPCLLKTIKYKLTRIRSVIISV